MRVKRITITERRKCKQTFNSLRTKSTASLDPKTYKLDSNLIYVVMFSKQKANE